jgi:hypothetical protein
MIIAEPLPEELATSTVERLIESTRPGCCVGADDEPEVEEPLVVGEPAGTGRCGTHAEAAHWH